MPVGMGAAPDSCYVPVRSRPEGSATELTRMLSMRAIKAFGVYEKAPDVSSRLR